MEESHTFVDTFENYSCIRGASRVGDFDDNTLASISAFQPLAVSTSTKWGKDVGSETYTAQANRFRLSLSSLVTTEDDPENRGDTSSLGLVHSDDFKSSSSTMHLPAEQQNENGSLGWNSSMAQHQGLPEFSKHQRPGNRTLCTSAAVLDSRNDDTMIAAKPLHNRPIENTQTDSRRFYQTHQKRAYEGTKPRLTAKPPRTPKIAHAPSSILDSVGKNDTLTATEKSTRSVADNSSFFSLTAIHAVIADLSASGSSSMLAKKIISKTETASSSSKKGLRKEEEQPGRNDVAARENNAVSSQQKQVPVAAEPNPVTPEVKEEKDEALLDNQSRSQHGEPTTDEKTVDSITVEMKVGCTWYKGILYAQPAGSA